MAPLRRLRPTGRAQRGHGTPAELSSSQDAVEGSTRAERVHAFLVEVDEDHGCGHLPEAACEEVPGNAMRIVVSQTLQSIGDKVVDAKAVLPWLLTAIGAPAAFIGFLVPIRESGSLLPQAALVPWIRRLPVRKWVWVAGGAGQALATGAMALAAATMRGIAGGAAVLAALAVFALSRALSSIASKDVLGRTVPRGQRGQINGLSTVTSGAVAVTLGLAIRGFGGTGTNTAALVLMLAVAALTWVGSLLVSASVTERAGGADTSLEVGWISHAVGLLRTDVPFRHFVIVRTLLLVSALSPPFVVTLGARETGVDFASLGPFVVASGLAGLLGGLVFGRLADRASDQLMVLGAAVASLVIVALLAVRAVLPSAGPWWIYPTAYLLLALAHTGVRVARKTYIIDLAAGNRRTDYVAVSNTAMGVLLLLTGALSSALAAITVEAALGFLAVLGFLGVIMGRSLPAVTKKP